MRFKALQENLRQALWARIDGGELTGLRLAEQTGFKQAHISNFLNRKRGLSVEGMDKVLNVQRLSVLDLLDPAEINKRASIAAPSGDEFENVFLVEGSIAAHEPSIRKMDIKDVMKFRKAFLRKLRPAMEGDREAWERFVLWKVDGNEGMSMFPRLLPGAIVLIDRHYNSLKPYRKRGANMYAVVKNDGCTVKYVEAVGCHLILKPHNEAYPSDVLTMDDGKFPSDYLIGRVCHISIET